MTNPPMLQKFYPLINPIMEYDWGSPHLLADWVGAHNDAGTPQAEMWMGTYPGASSLIQHDGRLTPLLEFINSRPEYFLGSRNKRKFGGRLPYLLKLIAVARPLSLQVHPDEQRALEGYFWEERNRISRDAPKRHYRDPLTKREMIYALTPFRLFAGFAPLATVIALLDWLDHPLLVTLYRDLRRNPGPKTITETIGAILGLPPSITRRLLPPFLNAIRSLAQSPNTAALAQAILVAAEFFPDDATLLALPLLQYHELSPGQALVIEAGTPHTYLSGAGLELMTNSDNVVRGGMTHKFTDVPEFLRLLRHTETTLRPLRPQITSTGRIAAYRPENAPFQLQILSLQDNAAEGGISGGPEMLFALKNCGEIQIRMENEVLGLALKPGNCIFIPSGAPQYSLSGSGEIYRITLN